MTDGSIIVSEPVKDVSRGVTTDGVAVRYDELHGICIDNYSDGTAYETVYVDPDEVPALVKSLTGMALEHSHGWDDE